MVYCPKCGAKNEEDAKYCVNCGAALYLEEKKEKRGGPCFGEPERRVEEECFGLPHGGAIAGAVFGVFIIIIGIAIAFGQDVGRLIGPFVLIVVGLLVILGAIYALRRRRQD